MKNPKDIDEYISGCPNDIRAILKKLRVTIKRAMPKADEAIKYGMPAFHLNGCRIYFAAWKKHIGFYPISSAARAAFEEGLAPYEVEKSTIRFPIHQPLPWELISNIVKFSVKEKSGKSALDSSKTSSPGRRHRQDRTPGFP